MQYFVLTRSNWFREKRNSNSISTIPVQGNTVVTTSKESYRYCLSLRYKEYATSIIFYQYYLFLYYVSYLLILCSAQVQLLVMILQGFDYPTGMYFLAIINPLPIYLRLYIYICFIIPLSISPTQLCPGHCLQG